VFYGISAFLTFFFKEVFAAGWFVGFVGVVVDAAGFGRFLEFVFDFGGVCISPAASGFLGIVISPVSPGSTFGLVGGFFGVVFFSFLISTGSSSSSSTTSTS
jgi:hypothetical protein